MKTILLYITVTATIYHAVPEQTDATPFITASNKVINKDAPGSHRWIAVSRDLEKLGFVFGAKVCVENAGQMNGYWTVQDRMNKRWSHRIDFLVDESMRGGKWENVKIYLVE
jgi:3D (Asp-Asp-Asp) domain-containing protein|tara:strand:+ start:3106 stop:3441 length:336 start_codon:yes stop_codon:yes gene_type:complete